MVYTHAKLSHRWSRLTPKLSVMLRIWRPRISVFFFFSVVTFLVLSTTGCKCQLLLYSHIELYVYIYNYTWKHSQHNIRTSMKVRTHFFIKIYLSHFIQKGWCWLCVGGELETGTDCYILTQSSSDHSSTSFSFWLSCSTVVTGAASPQSEIWFSRWHLVPTDSNCNWNRTRTDSNCNQNWLINTSRLWHLVI